jgi:hypothetical protein
MLPENSETFLVELRKDLKKAEQILVISKEFDQKRFLYTFKKLLNRGSEIFLISSNKFGDIEQLRLYKNIYIYILEPHRNGDFSFSAISIDSKTLYLFSTPITDNIFRNGYGIATKITNTLHIKSFEKKFIQLLERAKKIQN